MTRASWHELLRVAIILSTGAMLLAVSTSPIFSRQGSESLPVPHGVLDVAQRVNDYWIANRPGLEDNQWSRAVYFTGNMAYYQMAGDVQYLDHAWAWAETPFNWQLNDGCATVFADNQAAGQTYLALHDLDPQRANLDCLLSSIEKSMNWAWLEVDLGETTTINRVALNTLEDRAYKYLVDVKNSPSDSYIMVLDRSDATVGESTIASAPARFVRLRVIGAEGYTGPWVSLTEFQLFSDSDPATNLALNQHVVCSSEPEPQNNCANVVDGSLATRWSASFADNFSVDSPNWWWIDALYMASPVYAALSNLEMEGILQSKPGYSPVLYAKYNETKVQRGLYDTDEQLWYRDTRFLTLLSPNGEKIFWSRGNGWVFAAHARILETLPQTDPHYQEYRSTFQAMAAALVAKQDQAGYWNENLVDPNHCGGAESSGTAFFTYGLAWGINHQVLDRATFLPAVSAAWDWLANTAVQSNPNGLLGYVQAIGDAPACDENAPLPGPANSADFGVGAFLLAASEVYELAAGEVGSSTLHLPLIPK
ncbi:MAG: glycoside hydrolase family 88 protein [Caldilineaceae bacterium]|nr:glycoside hydrolase family 88 protein [Caldilineaceae bacterium]